MKLAVWTYEGPPHVGAMRVATALKDVHFVIHAPQGDTYADLLFTMIERRDARPPVTYTTFEARDLGGDTAEVFKRAVRDAVDRFEPKAAIVGASCTAELIQDDPGGLAASMGVGVPVVPVELPSYTRKEHWGAAETFYQVCRRLVDPELPRASASNGGKPTCNILGATALGFRHRDDMTELRRLLEDVGIGINVIAPLNAGVDDLRRLGAADFNVVPYPETGETTARWLERDLKQPFTKTIPIGVSGVRAFLKEVGDIVGKDMAPSLSSNLPWWSRSIDSNYLTGKRVFVFGESARAAAIARVARDEMAFEVVGLGGYNREGARDVRAMAKELGVDPLITDDYLDVEARIAELQPEMILGTQMERHIGKRLGIPCAVISAPVHVQDFPSRYSPHLGFEGANVLFDTFIHPLVMGLEEHLLGMFREDFEFSDEAGPSHLGHGAAKAATASSAPSPAAEAPSAEEIVVSVPEAAQEAATAEPAAAQPTTDDASDVAWSWSADAERELKKIPFFVRGKARRNTERFASDHGVTMITVDTLYDAKAHYGR